MKGLREEEGKPGREEGRSEEEEGSGGLITRVIAVPARPVP